jgi:hypothetical protein
MKRRAIAQYCGWVVPPVVWAFNVQLGQILPHIDCVAGLVTTMVACFGALLLAAGGTIVSCWTRSASGSRGGKFVAGLGAAVGCAFIFALLLQGAATLLLSACER